MKLKLDEYYIINDEWDEIENYMPEDMAEELEKFIQVNKKPIRLSNNQRYLIKILINQ